MVFGDRDGMATVITRGAVSSMISTTNTGRMKGI